MRRMDQALQLDSFEVIGPVAQRGTRGGKGRRDGGSAKGGKGRPAGAGQKGGHRDSAVSRPAT
jgi:hypothetical protein